MFYKFKFKIELNEHVKSTEEQFIKFIKLDRSRS
jgi:hypothetical protein